MRKVYRGRDVEVSFDLELCTHVGECLRGAPGVFQLERRPWVAPDADTTEAVIETILRCPSGALQYHRLDGGAQESHATTTVTPIHNGPLLVVGEITVRREDGTEETLPRASLCRCGESEHKPFCDNRHIAAGFKAPGVPFKIHLSPVRPHEDGPIARSADPRANS